MNRIRFAGLALVATLALAVAASAASAHHFVSNTKGTLLAESLSSQEFTTAAGTIACSKISLLNTSVTALLTESQEATVDYSGCKAFSIFEATVEPSVLYDFNANETATLLNKVTILVPADNCTVLVLAPQILSTVKYDNTERNGHKGIELLPKVSGITSVGEGGCKYAEESKGTYVGNSFVWLDGGNLSWL